MRKFQHKYQAMLVYQAGIANVFRVSKISLTPEGRDAQRVYQGSFQSAAMLARGIELAGGTVRTAACNMAGDIVNNIWTFDLENQPFSDKFIVVGK